MVSKRTFVGTGEAFVTALAGVGLSSDDKLDALAFALLGTGLLMREEAAPRPNASVDWREGLRGGMAAVVVWRKLELLEVVMAGR